MHPTHGVNTNLLSTKSTLDTSGEDENLHSKRVEKMKIYTRNEWRRWKFTLKTSGEVVELHSKRVSFDRDSVEFLESIIPASLKNLKRLVTPIKKKNYTRNGWRRSLKYTRNEWRRSLNYTRNECKSDEKIITRNKHYLQKSFLDSHLLHSFRVCFWSSSLVSSVCFIFFTRFECKFPLVFSSIRPPFLKV